MRELLVNLIKSLTTAPQINDRTRTALVGVEKKQISTQSREAYENTLSAANAYKKLVGRCTLLVIDELSKQDRGFAQKRFDKQLNHSSVKQKVAAFRRELKVVKSRLKYMEVTDEQRIHLYEKIMHWMDGHTFSELRSFFHVMKAELQRIHEGSSRTIRIIGAVANPFGRSAIPQVGSYTLEQRLVLDTITYAVNPERTTPLSQGLQFLIDILQLGSDRTAKHFKTHNGKHTTKFRSLPGKNLWIARELSTSAEYLVQATQFELERNWKPLVSERHTLVGSRPMGPD